MLLDDDNMIVDGSMLSVSTIIGQGLWHTDSTILIIMTLYRLFTGEFGVVYKGILKKGANDELVAIKSLKGV